MCKLVGTVIKTSEYHVLTMGQKTDSESKKQESRKRIQQNTGTAEGTARVRK